MTETSCCDLCLMGEEFKGSSTCGWKTVTVRNEVIGSLDDRLAIHVNDWLAADYEGAWYIGQVQQIDEQDGEVSFMTKGKGKGAASSFKWPTQKVALWLERKSILCVIKAPVPVGKSGHAFKLTEAMIELIEKCHGSYKL